MGYQRLRRFAQHLLAPGYFRRLWLNRFGGAQITSYP